MWFIKQNRLSEFQAKLETLMPDPYVRPLVCEGSPLDCCVFVVGHNPATPFAEKFWSHRDDEKGFLREKFLEDFREIRNQPGKLKGARARLEIIASNFKREIGRI